MSVTFLLLVIIYIITEVINWKYFKLLSKRLDRILDAEDVCIEKWFHKSEETKNEAYRDCCRDLLDESYKKMEEE